MRLVSALQGALAAAAVALTPTYAAIDGDLITSLPGFNGTFLSKQYSGYLSVGGGKFLHYTLAESENDPSTDPVVVWFNGGPGCSSMMGYWTEQGPFTLEYVAGEPVLSYRDTRWNQIANVIFLESPAGVGYSYATSPSGLVFNDTVTADDNLNALQAFFKGFPEYLDSELYITGESYAGVYVPTLSYAVYQSNKAGVNPKLNLKGLMVGNGCTGTEVGSCSAQGTAISVDFFYGKGLYPKALYDNITSVCQDLANPGVECIALLTEMSYNIGPVDIYDIYAPCIQGGLPPSEEERYWKRPMNAVERAVRENMYKRALLDVDDDDAGANPQPGPAACIGGTDQVEYLNTAAVRSAFHVKSEAEIGKWYVCSDIVRYTPTEPNEPRDIYPTLVENYRVTIYNGDVDACVPYNGNEEWTTQFAADNSLGFKSGTHGWRPWYTGNQVAGYVTEYESDFTFITIKGAGHEVPTYQPRAAYTFFERFINQKDF